MPFDWLLQVGEKEEKGERRKGGEVVREGQKNEEEVDGEEPPFLHCAAEFIITGPGRPHLRISAVERKRAGSPSIRNHLGLHFSPIYLPTNIVRYSIHT